MTSLSQKSVIRKVEILTLRLRTGWVTHNTMLTTFFVSISVKITSRSITERVR